VALEATYLQATRIGKNCYQNGYTTTINLKGTAGAVRVSGIKVCEDHAHFR
jgi:hypothetical protein